MLIIPERFNRNSLDVRALGSPADTGLALINYMCERIGINSLAGLDVLDFGCGVRFSDSILNRDVPIGSYTGLEVSAEIVEFLKENVTDLRMSYHHVNTLNRLYNPQGERLDPRGPSPLRDAKFDVVCMFSVVTHQQPQEAIPIFQFLRHHIRSSGHLFFSAFIHDDNLDYRELSPDSPGHMSSYSLPYISNIITEGGWSIVSVADPYPSDSDLKLIMTSFLCTATT